VSIAAPCSTTARRGLDARVPRALARTTGAAVVCIDHVVKSANGGWFAIGAQAKL
jgi:hypothetical protein